MSGHRRSASCAPVARVATRELPTLAASFEPNGTCTRIAQRWALVLTPRTGFSSNFEVTRFETKQPAQPKDAGPLDARVCLSRPISDPRATWDRTSGLFPSKGVAPKSLPRAGRATLMASGATGSRQQRAINSAPFVRLVGELHGRLPPTRWSCRTALCVQATTEQDPPHSLRQLAKEADTRRISG